MTLCQFTRAYVGKCGKMGVSPHARHPDTGEKVTAEYTNAPVEAVDGEEYCEYHLGVECVDCGEQAEEQCTSASSLVCGKPLCNDCGPFCSHHKW